MIIVEPVEEASPGLSRRPASCVGDLVSRIQEEERCFEDITINSRELSIDPERGRIRIGRHQEYELNDHSFAQLCSKFQIPTSYAHRCNNELFASNVNHWLHSENRHLLLRTSRNRLRAVLSDTYRTINNSEVLGWLQNRLGAETPIRYELTDKYLDVQIIRRNPEHGLSDGGSEGLHGGIHVRNSEVGASKIMISTLIYREICLN